MHVRVPYACVPPQDPWPAGDFFRLSPPSSQCGVARAVPASRADERHVGPCQPSSSSERARVPLKQGMPEPKRPDIPGRINTHHCTHTHTPQGEPQGVYVCMCVTLPRSAKPRYPAGALPRRPEPDLGPSRGARATPPPVARWRSRRQKQALAHRARAPPPPWPAPLARRSQAPARMARAPGGPYPAGGHSEVALTVGGVASRRRKPSNTRSRQTPRPGPPLAPMLPPGGR